MLYTYVVEKYQFTTMTRAGAGTEDPFRFWKIDVASLSRNFVALADRVRASGARFILVTQPIRFPRYYRGADTFDFDQVDRLLDSLRRDPMYVYDTLEISSLNQRLAVAREVQLAREHGTPVIDILPEIEELGDAKRQEVFVDMGHRSWLGNQIVGELIGTKLRALIRPDLGDATTN